MGAGELLLTSMDADGTKAGFRGMKADKAVTSAVGGSCDCFRRRGVYRDFAGATEGEARRGASRRSFTISSWKSWIEAHTGCAEHSVRI